MRRHVYYYTLTDAAFEPAAAVLGDDPARWLPAPAANGENGWDVRLHADGALPNAIDHLLARVTVGPTVRHGQRLLRQVHWRAVTAEPLFPKLDADLGLDALDGSGCHLSLMGTYRPPLSVVGGAGDLLYGHRVAEACVRRFVLDLADRLAAVVEAP